MNNIDAICAFLAVGDRILKGNFMQSHRFDKKENTSCRERTRF
jgi:hypothetical protein